MASPFGGQFVFSQPGTTVSLGNNGVVAGPSTFSGGFTLEIFFDPSLTSVPTTLDPGFNAGILDPNGGGIANNFLVGANLTLGTGAYLVTDRKGGASITLGSGNQTVVGAAGDTLIGGSGTQVLNALSGGQSVVGGTGNYTIYGGANDSISGPSNAVIANFGAAPGAPPSITDTAVAQIVGAVNEQVALPFSGNYTIGGAAGMTVTAVKTRANVQIGTAPDETVDLTGNDGNESIIATAGNDTVTGGGVFISLNGPHGFIQGASSIYGGVGDSITTGPTSTYVDATAGNMTVNVNGDLSIFTDAGSVDTVISGSGDTINVGDALLNLQYLAPNVFLNQTKSFPGALIVFGASGDTVTGVSFVDGGAGEMLINGASQVFGSTVAGAPDTVIGGGASLNFFGRTAGELINLAGSSGNATVNTFSSGETGDTVIASNGADSIWGGAGARIGVGATTPSGTATFDHSTGVAGASVAFGTNDSVAGSSTAKVSVTNFNTTNDTVFYAGRTGATQDATIIAAATTTAGNTTIVLPDGTSMTFVGLASAAALKFTS